MSSFKFIATCLFGLEKTLSFEIKSIGGSDIKVSDGKVEFSGNINLLIDSNLWIRTAERVFIKLGSFNALSFDDLFENTKKIAFENFIGSKDSFSVVGWSINSKLFSVSDCQSIIKKAIVERLKLHYNLEWFEETGSLYKINFSIYKDEVTIMIDSSGVGLHKRGYRNNSSAVAPIKETLAAGIIDLARLKGDTTLYDPFCGSGTFSIEACMKALNIAPGLYRKFSFENWGFFDKSIVKQRRELAISKINKDYTFISYASDIDYNCVNLTLKNIIKASLGKKIKVQVLDVNNFKLNFSNGNNIIICNPPYGKRLLDIKESEKLYKVMGDKFDLHKSNCYIITPHEDFEAIFGKKANKRRKLYNGMIKCQLFMYFNK